MGPVINFGFYIENLGTMGCAPSKKAHDDQAEEAQDEVPALPSDLPHTHNDIPLNDVQDIRAGKLRGNASVRSTGSARSLQRTGSESSQSRDAEIPARRANSEAFVHSDRSVKYVLLWILFLIVHKL